MLDAPMPALSRVSRLSRVEMHLSAIGCNLAERRTVPFDSGNIVSL